MKAIVIGASGHIGNAVTRELAARGYGVTAAARRPTPAANLEGLAVAYAPGDIDSPGQLDRWIEGHQIVVDAAAPYPSLMFGSTRTGAEDPLAQAARRTRSLIDSVRRHGAQLVYVSSFATLPSRRHGFERWQSETIRRLHPYFAVKELIENEILAAARGGMPAVIVNPTLCLGPWDLKPRELCFVPRLLCGEAPAAMAHVINVIDVRDVAAAIGAAIKRTPAAEPILLSGHNLSNQALYAWICEIGGVRPPALLTPATLAVAATYVAELITAAAGEAPALPALAAMLTFLHDSFDQSAGQRALGIIPRPLSATLADTVAWYREIGYC